MNEQRLVRRVLAGDQRAQQEFFLAYRDRLYRTCVHFLGYQDREAEDIVQEVFLIAHQKLAAFDFKHKLSTWLIQICVNLCFERLRQRKRVLLMMEQDLEATIDRTANRPGPGVESDEDIKQRKIGIVQRMIQTLGEQCRQIIELRDVHGESYISIARVLQIPIGTVMSRLHRCRAMLKERVLIAFQETA